MSNPSGKGVKLSTVVVAVFVLAISAMLSNYTIASGNEAKVEQSQ